MRAFPPRAVTLLVAAPVMAAAASAAGLRKGPYLIFRGEPSEMTVLWQTDGPAARSVVEWGRGIAFDRSSGPLRPGVDRLYEYTIAGLSPGERYSYRVVVDEEARPGSFMAAPGPSARKLTFYAYGDTRSRPQDHDRVCAAILKDIAAAPDARQTLLLHSGDWVGDGDKESEWDGQYFDRKRPTALALMSSVPVQGCRGNHEGRAALMRKYWPYRYVSPPACCHSFDYGPLHVTMIDQYTSYAPGSAQYEWIGKDLADTDRPWKVVLWHQPAWSAGRHKDDARAQRLQPLLERAGVGLVLAGHNHYYARCDVGGMPHVTAGGGGAPLYDPRGPGGRVVASRKADHFVRLEISETTLAVTAIDAEGKTIDSFTVRVRAPVAEPAP